LLGHLLRSKGPLNIVRRGPAIVERVGLTPGQMVQLLHAFTALLARYDAPVTFPVPALTLRRNPKVLQALATGSARLELAVHGYRHVDMSLLPPAAQAAELRRARALFTATRTPFTGFRAPYLRWDESLIAALGEAGFTYDSSRSALWPVVNLATLAPAQAAKARLLLDFCRPQPAEAVPVLPSWVDGLLELPVSFPDDEMLVERLDLTQGPQQAALWLAAFEQCHARGEMFVLQLHPERFFLCAEALEAVLTRAHAARPAVWLATLGDIAAWWQEKRACRVALARTEAGRWLVRAEGPARASLQVRANDTSQARYQPAPGRDFVLGADACPCVGVSPAASPALAQFLATEGYAVVMTDRPGDCTVFVAQTNFSAEDALAVLAHVEASSGPLVRFARWPDDAQSVLAVTGDIDSLTVWDYALRLVGA